MLNWFRKDSAAKAWQKRAEMAKRGRKLAGFYNENYAYEEGGERYLFRFPIKRAARMDPRAFDEQDVLSLLQSSNMHVPRILYQDPDGAFFVENYIAGKTLEEMYPPGQVMPDAVLKQVAGFYHDLASVELRGVTEVIHKGWPLGGTAAQFFDAAASFSELVFERYMKQYPECFAFLGLDSNPYAKLRVQADSLYERPWRLIHTDYHRGNIIMGEDGTMHVIDWELALYGDIMLCIASHIHRSRYEVTEKDTVRRYIKDALPDAFKPQFDEDLEFYLTFEALKSVITDTVRFPEAFQDEAFTAKKEADYCLYYSENLERIAPLLGTRTGSPVEVLGWIRDWGSARKRA